MSQFTQFLPQGDSFPGEMIAGPATVWGGNPTFSGKEYLRTGLIKTYSSEYQGLLEALPTACVANANASVAGNTGWYGLYYAAGYSYGIYNYAPPSIYNLGGNFHLHYPTNSGGGGNAFYPSKWGASLDSAPNLIFPCPTGGTDTLTGDNYLFNNRIFVYYSYWDGAWQRKIWSSTGGAYSISYGGAVPVGTFAASPSLLINAGSIDSTVAARIITSPDGVTWTDRISNLSIGTQRRLFYSTAAAAFFYINSVGGIYTSTDGYNWTAQTAPAEMPASVAGSSTATWVDTPTATYVMIGAPNTSSTYMLKITGLTTYQLIDLATTGSGNLVGLFSGTSGMIPYLNYNGTYIYMNYGKVRAYSTDGINWTLDTQLNNNPVPTYNTIYPVRNFINNDVYYVWTYAGGTAYASAIPFDYTGKSFGATPDFVGSASTVTFATGSSLSTYFRIR